MSFYPAGVVHCLFRFRRDPAWPECIFLDLTVEGREKPIEQVLTLERAADMRRALERAIDDAYRD